MEDAVPTNLAIYVKTKQLEITRAGLKQGQSIRKEVAHLKNINNRTEQNLMFLKSYSVFLKSYSIPFDILGVFIPVDFRNLNSNRKIYLNSVISISFSKMPCNNFLCFNKRELYHNNWSLGKFCLYVRPGVVMLSYHSAENFFSLVPTWPFLYPLYVPFSSFHTLSCFSYQLHWKNTSCISSTI